MQEHYAVLAMVPVFQLCQVHNLHKDHNKNKRKTIDQLEMWHNLEAMQDNVAVHVFKVPLLKNHAQI